MKEFILLLVLLILGICCFVLRAKTSKLNNTETLISTDKNRLDKSEARNFVSRLDKSEARNFVSRLDKSEAPNNPSHTIDIPSVAAPSSKKVSFSPVVEKMFVDKDAPIADNFIGVETRRLS